MAILIFYDHLIHYLNSYIYFWLNNPALAVERINERVKNGGHNIPDDIVLRRYFKGIINLFDYFIPACDCWLVADNSDESPVIISRGINNIDITIFNESIWTTIKGLYYDKQR